jgi:DNA polymerase-3 subunit gamma/tau
MSLFPEMDEAPGGGLDAPGAATASKRPAPARGAAPPDRPDAAAAGPPGAPYLALARKHRPASFDEVVGQEAAVATLKNAVATGRLHHAYLFSGIRGVGKTTAARLFARALNCVKGPTVDPCGSCDPCREIAAGLSMDVIEIDAASNRGVDDVEPLREAARYAPSRDRYKVFILDEVHMLSNAAFNSLLKILEEPPPRIVWILATTEHRKVPPTVVSRCQHFEFRRVPRSEVTAYLARIARREEVEVPAAGLEIIAAAAGGSVRDAVSLLDQVVAYTGGRATEDDVRTAIGAIDRRHLLRFLHLAAARDGAGLLDLVASLADAGTDFSQFAAGLVAAVRDAALLRFGGSGVRGLAATEDEAKELREVAAAFSEDGLLRAFHALLELPGTLRGAPQPRFQLEAAALRLARLADLTPIEDVIARLDRGPMTPVPQAGPDPAAGAAPPRRPGGPASTAARHSAGGAAAEDLPEGAAGGPEEGGVEPGWRARLLEAAQVRKLSLRTSLEAAHRIDLASGTLTIVMPGRQRFLREALETPESRALLREAAAEAVGRPVEVVVAVDDAAEAAEPPPDAGNGGAGRRRRLLEEAMKEPQVRRVLETFGGQVVDIRETT